MKKLQCLFAFLLLCLACEWIVASRCWKDPTCFCSGKQEKTIYCRNVRNVSDMEGILSNYSSDTIRLRIQGSFTTLPSRAFGDISVTVITINSPLGEDIPRDSLSGVRNLEAIYFNRTRYTKIPNAFTLQTFQTLQSTHGLLNGIETQLQNMTQATKISLSNNQISFIHPQAFLETRNLKVLDLSYNVLTRLNPGTFEPLKALKTIDLKQNKLYTIDGCFGTFSPPQVQFHAVAKITILHLDGNELGTLKEHEMGELTSLKGITLSNNPWTCNCDTWWFRNWLIRHNDSVLDLLNVRCDPKESLFLRNELIISLNRKELCSKLSLDENVIIPVCAAVLTLLIILCCYWKRRSLLAAFYYCGFTFLKSKQKHDQPYDAFLLYSDSEQVAAGEIAKGLEDGKYHFRLCIPSRDIPLPRRTEVISAYMLQCTKVIVLTTRELLEDNTQIQLLKSSMSFSLDSSAKNAIFIMKDDFVLTPELDPMVKAIVKSSVCLYWKECLFWQKLIYQLPSRKANKDDYYTEEEPTFLATRGT